jgi:pyrroloquinoline quinone (PQQ) biosynthesis protein C
MNTPTRFYQRLQAETQAERAALLSTPLIQHALSGQMTVQQYQAFLEQAYQHVRHTTPLLRLMASKMSGDRLWLVPALEDYAREEEGHEHWILSDIAATGGKPDLSAAKSPSVDTLAMVASAYFQIEHDNPIGFFGMVHVLEGTSVKVASHAADRIQASTGLPDAAFTYIRSHGGLDTEHVQYFETLVEQLTPEDQTCLLRCAKSFYVLYRRMFEGIAQAVGLRNGAHAPHPETLAA